MTGTGYMTLHTSSQPGLMSLRTVARIPTWQDRFFAWQRNRVSRGLPTDRAHFDRWDLQNRKVVTG